MNFRSLLVLSTIVLIAGSCKKEFDAPPIQTLPTGSVMTIADLRNTFVNNGGVAIQWGDSSDRSVFAVVTADEQNGNLYRNVYVQDNTGGLVLRLRSSGGLYQGDSLRIFLPGTTLSSYQGMLQLDSVDVDNNVVKQRTGIQIAPQVVTISQLNNALDITSPMQGKLVQLNNVQFIPSDTALTYSNAITQATENRTLENCGGDLVIVRNSGYADFAGTPVPNGKGSFVAVVGVFGSTVQLFIRDIDEVRLNDPRCGDNACLPASSVSQDFAETTNNADVNVECWLNTFTVGSRRWKGIVTGGENFVEARPASFDATSTMWLISPPVLFSPGMDLSFRTALGSAWLHDGLSVWISTDIDLLTGADVEAAPWVSITGANIASSSSSPGTWVPSGTVPLDSFLNSGDSFVIGFKYTGVPTTQNTPYRIDDVTIQ
jgi:hypothetical protein